jgi:hypothetical protein
MALAKSSLALALIGASVLTGGVAAFSVCSADQPYDDWDRFGHGLGPRALVVPADITLPDTDAGMPFVERPFDIPRSHVSKEDLVELFHDEWSSSTAQAWTTTQIAVSKTAIRVEVSDLTIPLPAETEDGLYLRPLALALRWSWDRFQELAAATRNSWWPCATLIVDRDVPYRVLTQVFWTVGQNEFRARYAARTEGHVVGVERPLLDLWRPGFRVEVTNDGFLVKARGAPIEKLGKDYAALTDAGNRWKAASLENAAEQEALITGEPETRYEDLLRAEAALRAEGAFPKAQWGIDRPMSELERGLLQQLSRPSAADQ